MATTSAWDAMSPFRAYGVSPQAPPAIPASTPIPSIARSGGPGVHDVDHSRPTSPDHPLFWVAALGLVTFGVIFASTTVRIGPVKVAASAGKG